MKSVLAVALAVTCSCKSKSDLPPPIEKGKCAVEKYVGNTPEHQICNYEGYSWSCDIYNAVDNRFACTRGPELTERPIATE